jgi:hypothetical protein
MQSRKKFAAAVFAAFLLLNVAPSASAAMRRDTQPQPGGTVVERIVVALKRLKKLLPVSSFDDMTVPHP